MSVFGAVHAVSHRSQSQARVDLVEATTAFEAAVRAPLQARIETLEAERQLYLERGEAMEARWVAAVEENTRWADRTRDVVERAAELGAGVEAIAARAETAESEVKRLEARLAEVEGVRG